MPKKILFALFAAMLFLACKPQEKEDILEITDVSSYDVPSEGGEVKFTVRTNVEWSIIHNPAYDGQCDYLPGKGKGSQVVTALISENNTLKSRSFNIVVAWGGERKTLTIAQAAGKLVAGYKEGYGPIHSLGGETFIDVATSLAWSAEIVTEDAKAWVRLEGASGTGSGEFKAVIDDFYNYGDPRVAIVEVKSESLGKTEKKYVEVKQEGVNIPDLSFRSFLHSAGAVETDGAPDYNILRITNAGLTTPYIFNFGGITVLSSLVGIEHFPNVRTLNISRSKIEALDLSRNTELRELICSSTPLAALDLTKNTELTDLDCSSTQITSLALTNNAKLVRLNCSLTDIQSLNVDHITGLEYLNCHTTMVSMLNLTNNTALKRLYCGNTYVTSLDVSQNKGLQQLSCSESKLETLDVSGLTALETVECYHSPSLSTLKISGCSKLRVLALFLVEGEENGDGDGHDHQPENEPYNSIMDDEVSGLRVLNMSLPEKMVGNINPYKTIVAEDILAVSGNYVWKGFVSEGNPVIVNVHIRRNAGLDKVRVSGNTLLQNVYATGCGLLPSDISGSDSGQVHI